MSQLPFKHFDIIERPLITEKSSQERKGNQVFFVVKKSATKTEIKAAVEHVFNVKVKAVNTLILKGKTKRFRGHLGQQSDLKKAMVTLAEGQRIDLASGV